MKRFLVFLLLVAASCATAPVREPVHVVIAATTDVHGWFNGHADTVSYGGLPVLASYVEALRADSGSHVILVDSGDLFQGTLESNLFEGEPVILAYNQLRYAAAAVGNHEFDYGPVGPDSVARKPGDDSLSALKRNAGRARFPFLSANLTEKATGRTPSWARPSTIVDAGGVKIGIIGLSLPNTPDVTVAANVATLSFGEPVAPTIREAASLRRRGADAVIVIAHIGSKCSSLADPHDLSTCEPGDSKSIDFVQALPPGTIDAYFGGHTHQSVGHFVGDVPDVQALALSREFATVDLFVDSAAHRVLREKTVIRPHTMICAAVYAGTDRCNPRLAPPGAAVVPRVFLGRRIQPDKKMASLLQPFLDRVAARRNEPLGIRTADRFTRGDQKESTLGNLLTDALRAATGADFAMINSGAIRSDLRAGDLVFGDLFEVSPFDNAPSVVTMTGAQIKELLRLMSTGGRMMQVSGLRYTVDAATVSVTLPDGSPLDPEHLYRVAMPDFIATGGDGTTSVMQTVPADRIAIDAGRNIRDLLIEGLRGHRQPLTPGIEGRITVVK